jgi:hypothetical protein
MRTENLLIGLQHLVTDLIVGVWNRDRPKQEFSLSAETECSAAKNHRVFGFDQIFGTFLYFWPKVNFVSTD